MLRLVKPSQKYQTTYLKALKEFTPEDRKHWFEEAKFKNDLAGYVRYARDIERGINLPKGYVPASTYWLMDGATFIGRVSIRHRLNAHLKHEGGHIGYVIRPSKRKKGYGKEILRLALKRAKAVGIKKALVTCDEGNEGSRKIIEANGGVFENKVKRKAESPTGGDTALRYWINLSKPHVGPTRSHI